ncbi:MAG: hypothetical protein V5A56_12295 [Halolamina sp.]
MDLLLYSCRLVEQRPGLLSAHISNSEYNTTPNSGDGPRSRNTPSRGLWLRSLSRRRRRRQGKVGETGENGTLVVSVPADAEELDLEVETDEQEPS